MKPVHSKYAEAESLNFPGAITLRILISGKDTDGKVAVFEDIVQPGIGPGHHIHNHQNETFFFLDGQFHVEVDGQLYHMSSGDVAFIPRGSVHAFKNVGESPGRLRYVFSPALSMEEMFRELYATMEQGELSFELESEVAARHGQEFVGPPL